MGKNPGKEQAAIRERVYCFLVEYVQKNGFSPSKRQICSGTSLNSTESVYRHLQAWRMKEGLR